MANFTEYITYNEIREICLQSGQELIKEQDFLLLGPLQQILQSCYAINAAINNPNGDMSKIYMFGAKLIIQIRSFLLSENIYFSIGATTPKGQQLSTKILTQDELLSNLQVNLKTKQIELNSLIEKFDNNNISNVSDLWSKVYEVADVNGWNNKLSWKEYITSRGKKARIYQKPDRDINVWFRYYTRQKKRYFIRYYFRGGNDYLGFNNGWLYEWLQEYIQDHNQQLLLEMTLNNPGMKTPLSDMMSKASRENIEFYKGGDYIDAAGRQVQAKLGNKRIMSFASIKRVITSLITIIESYINPGNDQYQTELLGTKLTNLFTHKDTINQSYDEIVNKLLQNLQLSSSKI